MLSVRIKKKLGAFKLDVKFETESEVLALLGPSGCGKSMTLKCIAGIEKPDEGRIVLDGRVLFDSEKHIDLTPQQRRVGYLFQQYALFPNMTVYQNIFAGARRLPKERREAAVSDMVERIHLEGLEKKKPAELSGGQQQRVALARILVSEPEALLLDEPFSALDATLKWQLELELLETLSSFSGAAVYVSHDPDEVARLCSSVCTLSEGRSLEKRSSGAYFAELSAFEDNNLVECRVTSVLERGASVLLTVVTPEGTEMSVELPTARWRAIGAPESVRASIDPQKIMLLK